jgi:hypothetical protein
MDQQTKDNLILKARVKNSELLLKDHEELIQKMKDVLPTLLTHALLEQKKVGYTSYSGKEAQLSYTKALTYSDYVLLEAIIHDLINETIPTVWTSEEIAKYQIYSFSFRHLLLRVAVENRPKSGCEIS